MQIKFSAAQLTSAWVEVMYDLPNHYRRIDWQPFLGTLLDFASSWYTATSHVNAARTFQELLT